MYLYSRVFRKVYLDIVTSLSIDSSHLIDYSQCWRLYELWDTESCLTWLCSYPGGSESWLVAQIILLVFSYTCICTELVHRNLHVVDHFKILHLSLELLGIYTDKCTDISIMRYSWIGHRANIQIIPPKNSQVSKTSVDNIEHFSMHNTNNTIIRPSSIWLFAHMTKFVDCSC